MCYSIAISTSARLGGFFSAAGCFSCVEKKEDYSNDEERFTKHV